MPKVKVCCINSLEEAKLAIRSGASAIGLVSEMPSGPGVISESKIAEVASQVPEYVDTFLLTSQVTADEILAQHDRCKTTTIQLVDSVSEDVHRVVKETLPHIKLVQVIHITGKESVEKARSMSPYVDALLLDSGNQSLEVKELGGTGRTHDWTISREIVESVSLPVYLAGGLNPGNVGQAVRQVQPYGLDVCSGLRSQGSLDASKVEAFFKEIK